MGMLCKWFELGGVKIFAAVLDPVGDFDLKWLVRDIGPSPSLALALADKMATISEHVTNSAAIQAYANIPKQTLPSAMVILLGPDSLVAEVRGAFLTEDSVKREALVYFNAIRTAI